MTERKGGGAPETAHPQDMAFGLAPTRRSPLLRRETIVGYALLLPSLAVFLVFFIYPVVYSLYLSFFRWDMMMPMQFVGARNYHELLGNAEFREVLGNTLQYSAGVVVLAMGIGLVLALLLNRRTSLSSLFQACIFTSYIVSWVAVSLLWIWMLDPQYGLINYLAGFLKMPPMDWLGNHRLALWSLVAVTVWKIVGGSRHFAYGQPGAGDLYVTCQAGRTGRLGRLLGMGHSIGEEREITAGETLDSAEIVREMGKALAKPIERGRLEPDELPVLRALIDILIHGQPVNVPLERFLGGIGRI